MPILQLGSQGQEVMEIQRQLKSLGLYQGPIDGDYGGGTYASVKAFQQRQGMEANGKIGPEAWKALTRTEMPTPSIWAEPLDYKCLALTGTIETGKGAPDCFGAVSGDFDGQGVSYGVCQWNFGQDTLQPLLRKMFERHPDLSRAVFQENLAVLQEALQKPHGEQMDFVRRTLLNAAGQVIQPWKGMFLSLGRTREFQDIEKEAAAGIYQAGLELCRTLGLWSERAAALLFDIKVQNGSIKAKTLELILAEFKTLPAQLTPDEAEVAKMRIVANRRAEDSNPRWVEDVRTRKLAIAEGSGTVHGLLLDMEQQFGLKLVKPG